MEDEFELLRDTVRTFSEKNLDEKKIESEGITENTIQNIASQGFLGARIPSKFGGSELDEKSYNIILQELSKYSPSVAMRIFILNSLYYPLAKNTELESTLSDASSGKLNVTVDFLNNNRIDGEKFNGIVHDILNANSNKIIVFGKNPAVVDGGTIEEKDFMGFRGLKFGDIKVDSDLQYLNTTSTLNDVLENSYNAISSINLGLISGALDKAMEYSTIRKAFDYTLSSYEPVAFNLSKMISQKNILENILNSNIDSFYALNFSMNIIVETTRYALNVHGGYGYFSDFGVEKFYRDAMVMKSIFYGNSELKNLSEHVFGNKIRFI